MSTGKLIRSTDTPNSPTYKEIVVRYYGEWQEYQVQPILRATGKVRQEGVYYTDDRQDAISTMEYMAAQWQLQQTGA